MTSDIDPNEVGENELEPTPSPEHSGLENSGPEHPDPEQPAPAPEATATAGYYSPEPEEYIEPEPEMTAFDIAKDEIPSFGALADARSQVFTTTRVFEGFRARVDALGAAGEEARRRGLGMWMMGRYVEAAEVLAAFPGDDVASYTRGRSLVSAGRPGEAAPIFEGLAKKYPEESRPLGDMLDAALDAGLKAGDVEKAVSELESTMAGQSETFKESAEGRHLRGRIAELSGDYQEAMELFQAARSVDPTHRRNLFRLAYVSERAGQEQLALDAYETLATMLPVDRAVMINLGVLYEDLGRDSDAAACYDTIVRTDATDRAARLYLEDAKAGMSMYYDEDLEKKEDRLNQILRIPITDFELSVRARNCLNKMDIMTLGDLVKKTESELLSYKNFGETSLTEIKEILASKGLRLGMAREEAVASIAKARNAQEGRDLDPNDPRNKPISELKLSIRARRTVENLGCLTLGDITAHSEEELLGMPNFGVTSLLELRNRLAEYNLTLKGDD
ncbi:MAG: DNA-directed RNA polymerase subunit alpha C-terminal domain-containing protein [Planctomycetota bacterium]